MAVLLGFVIKGPIGYDYSNPYITGNLDVYDDLYDPRVYDYEYKMWSALGRPARTIITESKAGFVLNSFFNDFYFRVYVDPTRIDLGTIASPQSRQVSLWNAYPYDINLQEIIINNGSGVAVEGHAAPLEVRGLQELFFDIDVSVNGSPSINAEIIFDFSDVDDEPTVLVVGSRAVRFSIEPEVPVRETWEWLSDVFVATDGTEQRAQVRIVPRSVNSFTALFTTQHEFHEFYAQLLTSQGRLWIPEYQYATRITAESAAGSTTIYFDDFRTDVRAGEYVLVQTPTNAVLSEVLSVGSGSATFVAPLTFDVPRGSLVVPGAPSILDDGVTVQRYAVDVASQVDITAHLQRQRSSLKRPGVADVIPLFLGSKVLERRPLADELVPDSTFTGQEVMDNEAGMYDAVTAWDYSRISGSRKYKIHRIQQPAEMDYWREFFEYARGQARMFWTSTYRNDLLLTGGFGDGVSTVNVAGTDYVDKIFAVPTHRYLEFATAAGSHYAKVTAATSVAGDTALQFDPPVPAGPGWSELKRISYLLPTRLGSDNVEWEHYGLESLLTMTIRTAEAQES